MIAADEADVGRNPSHRRSLEPLSLAAPFALVVWAGCGGTVVAVLAAELLSPGLASLGSLLFVPVVAAGWLLPAPQFSTVALVAIAARALGAVLGSVDPGTAVVETLMIALIALCVRIAARGVQDSREAQARLHAQSRRLAVLADRDRIAQAINEEAIGTLFRATLRLEAAASMTADGPVASRVAETVAELDGLCGRLRDFVLPAE